MGRDDEIFRRIADDLHSKHKVVQKATAGCMAVLDGIVRPAIRKASEVITSDEVEFNENSLSITVWKGEEEYDKLTFVCKVDEFQMVTERASDPEPLMTFTDSHSVSSDLVVNHIDRFLRESLKLPKSKDRKP